METIENKTFSQAELRDFRVLLDKKLEGAEGELKYLKGVSIRRGKNIKEQGYEDMSMAEVDELIGRQEGYIQKLKDALQRIKDKTYGICEVTGELIDKNRLLKIPHTTFSHKGKLEKYASSTDVREDVSPKELHDEKYSEAHTEPERKCRVCGCTENDCSQCVEKTGYPCYWVEDDLCSACVNEVRTGGAETIILDTTNSSPTNTEIIMDFFKQLAAAGKVDLTMRIMQKDDKLSVSIFPSGNSKMTPIVVTGTPEELDEEFFKSIAPAAKEVNGIISNIDDVKKAAAAKKEKKAASLGSKPAAKKPVAKKPAQKKPSKSKSDSSKPKSEKSKSKVEKKQVKKEKPVKNEPPVQETPKVEEPVLFS